MGTENGETVRDLGQQPFWLAREAATLWDEVAEEAVKQGLLDPLRVPLLAVFCQSYARCIEANKILRRDGLTRKTKSGEVAVHPAARLEAKAMSDLLTLAKYLGISSPRVRLE